jgi:hypothetical protein
MLAVVGFLFLCGCGFATIRTWLKIQAAAILEFHDRLDRLDTTFQAILNDHDAFQETSDKQLLVLSRICTAMDRDDTLARWR